MNKRINFNDSTAWSEFDWSDPVVPEALKKSDATVNRSRSAFFKKDDPTFSKTMSEVAVARNQDPEYLENHRVGIAHRDNTYQAESNAKPEVKAKISKSLTGKAKSAEHKKALKATTTNKPGDEKWEAAHKTGLAKRDKPFHAGEYGTFASLAEAARYAATKGMTNAYNRLSGLKKTRPTEYYFITESK